MARASQGEIQGWVRLSVCVAIRLYAVQHLSFYTRILIKKRDLNDALLLFSKRLKNMFKKYWH